MNFEDTNEKESLLDRTSERASPLAQFRVDSLSLLGDRQSPKVCIPTLEVNDSRVNVCNDYSVDSRLARVYQDNKASIVKINTLDAATRFENRGSTGTGFIVNTDGTVATGYHVVKDAVDIKVRMDNGKVYTAHIKSVDMAKDVALLQIEKQSQTDFFRPVELENTSSTATRNRRLVALGFPNDQEALHLSEATVNARQRFSDVKVRGGALPGEDVNREIIATKAHVNNGNSGGPVFDLESGKVVGMVNLSNQVDTFLNPIEDLNNFLARNNYGRDSQYASAMDAANRMGTAALAMFMSGQRSLGSQISGFGAGKFLTGEPVATQVSRVPQITTSINPYVGAASAGITMSRETAITTVKTTISPLLGEFKRTK